MEEKPKIQAWNMDEPQQYKDIVPGDEINQRAAINAAYNDMGKAMAKEKLQDQQYKDDTKQFVNEAANINQTVPFASNVVGIDKAMDGVLAYYAAKTIYWFSHPIPGLRQSKAATIIFGASSILIAIIVITMVYLAIAGMGGPFGKWLTANYHSIFGIL